MVLQSKAELDARPAPVIKLIKIHCTQHAQACGGWVFFNIQKMHIYLIYRIKFNFFNVVSLSKVDGHWGPFLP